jgi:uncharacterized membrane protein YdjX (TVP38/TMEM64 family)
VKKQLSLAPRLRTVLLALFLLAVVAVFFYGYQEGLWRSVLHSCKPFFQPKYLYHLMSACGPYAAAAFVLIQALQVVIAPVPGEVTGFVGGLFFGVLPGTFLSTIGLVLGSLLAFFLARQFGLRLVRKIVKQEFIDRFNRYMAGRGFILIFILFLVPGMPKDSLCYLLGLTGMGYVDFILLNAIARLPGTVMLTLQGHAVHNEKYLSFVILFLVSALLLGVLYFARKKILAHLGVHEVKQGDTGEADIGCGEGIVGTRPATDNAERIPEKIKIVR